jgi:siroheme synthase (precorrin-2 oxidase/ferrochelatase)
MNKRSRKAHRLSSKLAELVVVASAESMDEAKDFETLLKNNDIPAIIKRHHDEFTEGKRFFVMVPEEMADEAHVIIESQDSYDDFYDSEMDDTDDDDLEGDIFED